ncbi:protein NPGR2 [Neltuma alba]|uniref:protein NPGR2 n=1 Tax=Neltuma alba TaxID=207710 RepID=UPI0010A40830|nr:protein NPGR2-like [Prosopis alba]XP_028765487.1 protein NPGR2-like [Prosopis alba]XP_028765488.1 protein NPGR2-like [Prosopis alba]XP_028765489.1 protein NPGR2-like [Prosopis alba]
MGHRIRADRKGNTNKGVRKVMKCLCSEEPLREEDDNSIEEVESSLCGSGCLNYEEARARLGKCEYQKGNIEAAVHVFEQIDTEVVASMIKSSLAKRGTHHERLSQNHATRSLSIHSVGLLLEAFFLKAKSLQALGKFKEAALSCKVILDMAESSLPRGLPENFGVGCKLQETLSSVIELLPHLWKLADSPHEAIMSYRRALLHKWNLDAKVTAKIQKEFAVFLLYSGVEASPPSLRSQMDTSYVPRNNIEEAILLLMILLRQVCSNRIEWDPSILDHLSFALSVSGDLTALANQLEQLLPSSVNPTEKCQTLAFCYYGAGQDLVALGLLRKMLCSREDPKHVSGLLMAAKICCENPSLAGEGVSFARRLLEKLEGRCDQLASSAYCFLGLSFSAHSKSSISDSERYRRQSEALHNLEVASRMTRMRNPLIQYHLSLEYAEQRKLDAALDYAKCLLELEAGSNIKGWLLLARILSAQSRFLDSESVINAALDQTGKWDQGNLLRTKAKLQIAQGRLRSGIETYIQLLAVLQIQSTNFGSEEKLNKDVKDDTQRLEMEIWHDLAFLYISQSKWHDAGACLSKSKGIKLYSASRCHATGLIYEAKGLYKEALKAYREALDIDPNHVPSLISNALVLRRCSKELNAAVRGYLMDALRHDRMNASAWYHLGILHKAEGTISSLVEAMECFKAAQYLEETAPVEPFR